MKAFFFPVVLIVWGVVWELTWGKFKRFFDPKYPFAWDKLKPGDGPRMLLGRVNLIVGTVWVLIALLVNTL